jgi:hypothetical protein
MAVRLFLQEKEKKPNSEAIEKGANSGENSHQPGRLRFAMNLGKVTSKKEKKGKKGKNKVYHLIANHVGVQNGVHMK